MHRVGLRIPAEDIAFINSNWQSFAQTGTHQLAGADRIFHTMEHAIIAAIRGWSPDPQVFGTLDADQFLRVVDDVTSWSLTNFESFRARSPAEEIINCWRP